MLRRHQPTSALAARRKPVRAATASSWLALVAAAVVVVSQVFALGHMLFVSHTWCEHGQLVHESSEPHASAAPAGADRHEGQALHASGGSAEHDHCDPCATPVGIVTVGPSFADISLLDGSMLPWSVRAATGARVLSILSLAPKNSPNG